MSDKEYLRSRHHGFNCRIGVLDFFHDMFLRGLSGGSQRFVVDNRFFGTLIDINLDRYQSIEGFTVEWDANKAKKWGVLRLDMRHAIGDTTTIGNITTNFDYGSWSLRTVTPLEELALAAE